MGIAAAGGAPRTGRFRRRTALARRGSAACPRPSTPLSSSRWPATERRRLSYPPQGVGLPASSHQRAPASSLDGLRTSWPPPPLSMCCTLISPHRELSDRMACPMLSSSLPSAPPPGASNLLYRELLHRPRARLPPTARSLTCCRSAMLCTPGCEPREAVTSDLNGREYGGQVGQHVPGAAG